MPWLIQHKCNMYQTEESGYGVLRKDNAHNEPVTLVMCDKCGEQFVIEGHEMFDSAVDTKARDRNYDLPSGFVVASKKPS